jgi:hypothetical protein
MFCGEWSYRISHSKSGLYVEVSGQIQVAAALNPEEDPVPLDRRLNGPRTRREVTGNRALSPQSSCLWFRITELSRHLKEI